MREFAAHTGSRTDRPIMWTHPTIREACDKDFSEHTAAIELDIAEVMRKYGVNAAWSAKVLTLPPPASIICSGIWRCFSLSPSERKKNNDTRDTTPGRIPRRMA